MDVTLAMAWYSLFIWIRNNWIGASQSDACQPISASFSETTEAVYRPMHVTSRGWGGGGWGVGWGWGEWVGGALPFWESVIMRRGSPPPPPPPPHFQLLDDLFASQNLTILFYHFIQILLGPVSKVHFELRAAHPYWFSTGPRSQWGCGTD